MGKKCVFIGYQYGKKGQKLFDFETEEIFVSRDVEFIETKYPFAADDVATRNNVPPNNWTCEQIVDDVSDDIVETHHTGDTEVSGDMTMDDRG